MNVKKKIKDLAYDEWISYLVIRGSDEKKYGSLKKNLMSHYSLGNDKYPKTVKYNNYELYNQKFEHNYWYLKNKNKIKREENNKK